MGKGTVMSGGSTGSYQVKLNLDRRRITAGIAKANTDITDITGLIAEIQTLIDASNVRLSDLQADIDFYGSDLEHYQTEYDQAMKDYQAELVIYRGLASRKAYYSLVILSLQKRKQYLESAGADPEVSAWCADLTEDLTGEVGTVEVPGERGSMLIRPGYDGGAVYSAARDGQLQQAIAGTPESVFYNWAMLTGWQKWKPTFRTGEITSLGGDTCSVLLDAALSSAQDLDVNQAAYLSGVPIEYMD